MDKFCTVDFDEYKDRDLVDISMTFFSHIIDFLSLTNYDAIGKRKI